jgi:hypothetical protein
MREAGRETGHFQITCDCLAPRNPEVFYQKRDFITLAASGKTLIMPPAVLALEH